MSTEDFIAHRPGRCGTCGERFPAGTEIRFTHWMTRVSHTTCAKKDDPEASA